MPRSSKDATASLCLVNALNNQTTNGDRASIRLERLSLCVTCALLFIFTCNFNCTSLTAQTATATLGGTVIDEQNSVIAGARVTVMNLVQGFQRTVQTNSDGVFVVPLLPPGSYIVKTDRDGFTTLEIRDVVLNVNDQVALSIQLKVGSITGEVITVLESQTLLEQTPAIGTSIDRQFVENLPVNGRSFQTLINLTPGVVVTKSTFGEQGQFSVNGQRADANYFTIDGVSANSGVSSGVSLGQTGGGSLPALAVTGGTNNLVSLDALQEFTIQTSTYAAEFGRTPGAQISIVTRSGTNNFHGTLFEYFRNDALDANDWFANSRGLLKAALRQNDFGMVFGGPVLLPRLGEGGRQLAYDGHKRTFFFFSYEGLRLRVPQTAIVEFPSMSLRQMAPPQLRPFLNSFPIPNGPATKTGLAEFAGTYSDPSELNAASLRVDHVINNNLTVFGRYNYAPSKARQRGGGNTSVHDLSLTSLKTITLTGGATFAFTPATNNEFRGNWSKSRGVSSLATDNLGGSVPASDASLFVAPFSRQDSAFTFALLGTVLPRFIEGNTTDNSQRQISIVDNFSTTVGRHQLKFGVDYRWLSPIFAFRKYVQQVQFNDVASVLASRASSVTIQVNTVKPVLRYTNLSVFGQDTLKQTRRLTLTLGLRWELNPAPSEKSGNDQYTVRGLDNPTTMTLAPLGTKLYKTTYNNFAPRIGIAYQLSEQAGREIVVRGGYGLFYDLGNNQSAQGYSAGFFPYVITKVLPNVAFPLDAVNAAPPVFSLAPPYGSMFVHDPELKLPRTHQWSLTIDQSLGAKQVFSASYVGAAGRRLLRQELLLNPNPSFTQVRVVRNTATSDYQALQLKYQRRLSGGIQALASYTWSHSLDNASNDSAQNTPNERIDPQIDRGPSDFDVRHAFNATATYNIPHLEAGPIAGALLRNWSLDAIATARSATPVNVVTGTVILGVINVFRPDVIPGIPLFVDDPGVGGGRRINKPAFQVPPATRQGSLGRNVLRGFPVWQIDAALRRQIDLTERINIQFRAEFFNIFNHPNFADPNGQMTSGLFGQSPSMLGRSLGTGGMTGGFNPLFQIGGPRSIQFALRVNF